jgi:hypothetical protein
VRLGAAVAVLAGGLPLLFAAQPVAAATHNHIASSRPGARPGGAVTITGSAPRCAMQPFETYQGYTNRDGSRVQAQGAPGVTDADGHFTFIVKIPSGAVRSNLFRPFAAFQYDTVVVSFPGCHNLVLGLNLRVRPFNKLVRLTLSPERPRSGSKLRITATHCHGGVLPEFTQLIDRTGEYFHFEGDTVSGTFKGEADLSHGYYGLQARGGPAHASARGAKDALAMVACTQAQGPRWVARQEKLQHLTVGVDVHIRPKR